MHIYDGDQSVRDFISRRKQEIECVIIDNKRKGGGEIKHNKTNKIIKQHEHIEATKGKNNSNKL